MRHPGCLVLTALSLALCLAPALRSQSYTVTDLGAFPGDFQSQGRAVNNTGQVAGASYPNGSAARGFLWDPAAGLQDLGTLGGTFTSPVAVNDFGQVTGLSYVTAQPTNYHAFLADVNGILDLGTFGSGIYDTSQAGGLNNLGAVVGTSRLPSGFTTGFLWTADDGLLDLSDLLGTRIDGALAVNDAGQMVLAVGTDNYFYDTDGSLTPIGTNVTIYALNQSGRAAGSVGPAGTAQPCVWDAVNGLQMIPLPAPFQSGQAFGINASGVVIGTMSYRQGETGMVRGFLWAGGDVVDLSTAGWTVINANGINDNGQIAATGSRMGQTHALLLTPN